MKKHAVPIVAAVFLLLPLLYLGSYLALVKPSGGPTVILSNGWYVIQSHYRCGGNLASLVFWPLEQIDRKVRPDAWAYNPARTTAAVHAQYRSLP